MSTAPLPAKHSIQWYHEYLLFKKSWGAHCAAESERGDFLWTSRPDRMIWSRLSFAIFVCSVLSENSEWQESKSDIYPFGLPSPAQSQQTCDGAPCSRRIQAHSASETWPMDSWNALATSRPSTRSTTSFPHRFTRTSTSASEMVAVTGGQSDLKVTSHRRYGWETYWQDRLPALDVPSRLDVSHLASSGVKTFGQQLRSLKLYPWENVMNKYFAWHVPCCLRAFASSESSR